MTQYSEAIDNSGDGAFGKPEPFPRYLAGVLFVFLAVALGGTVTLLNNPMSAATAAFGIALAMLVIARVEIGFLVLVFITQSDLSTVIIDQFGGPSIAKILVPLITVSLAIRLSLPSFRPSGWQRLTILILLYGITGLFSMLFSSYVDRSVMWLISLAKDSLIAIIAVLIIRQYKILRLTFWALIASGTLLGTVALIQYLTGTFTNSYWGLSLAPSHQIIGEIDDFRLSGTLGDPNYFALFQLILLPLALDRLISERSVVLKAIALYSLGAILFTIVFSYSRGAFLGIALMCLAFVLLYRRKAWKLVAAGLIILSLLSISSNSHYVERMLTLSYLTNEKRQPKVTEGSFQGRKSEMIVALLIFRDHPLIGVGVGNYENYYRKYARDLFIDFRNEDREAHCRYLEILAETGITGIIAFGAIIYALFQGLLRTWRRARSTGLKPLEYSSVAMGIAIIGLLTGYIFLHDAWPRFSWLLFGIAFAIPNLMESENKTDEQRNTKQLKVGQAVVRY